MLTLLGMMTGVEWIEDIELGGQSAVMRGWRMTPVKKRREYVVLGVLEEEGTNMVWMLEWGAFTVPLTLEEHVVRV